MSGHPRAAILRAVRLAAVLAPLLGGCTYDYLQHTDRVGYGAGNAVAANLEAETINPSKGSMYVTSGLGKNGVAKLTGVTPQAPTASSSAPSTSTP